MFGCRAGTPSKSSLFSHGPPSTRLQHPGRLKRGQRAVALKNYFILGPCEATDQTCQSLWVACEQVVMPLEATQRKDKTLTISSLKENKIWVFRYFLSPWTSAHIWKSDRKSFTVLQKIHFLIILWFHFKLHNQFQYIPLFFLSLWSLWFIIRGPPTRSLHSFYFCIQARSRGKACVSLYPSLSQGQTLGQDPVCWVLCLDCTLFPIPWSM